MRDTFFRFLSLFVPSAQIFFSAQALAMPLPREIARALNDAGIPTANAAFLVRDVGSGATLLSHNADAPMNPASVMKLVTTAAALELLGPAFTWKTELFITSTPESGTLKTPLYIRASGDPKITFEDLETLIARVRGHGIAELAGGVVIDKRVFAPTPTDTAAFDRSPLRPYNVTPEPMLFNFKAVGFKMAARDGILRITPEPFPEGVAVENTVKIVNGPCGDWKTKLRATFDDGERTATARFAGTYAADCGDKEWFVSLLGHEAFFEGSLRWMWKKLGGGAVGNVRTGEIPATARLLDTHLSQPLTAAISDVNKFSNNVMARHLLLALDPARPATAAGGARAVQAWLAGRRIAAPELVIENGSGLSRGERVSPRTLDALLQHMHAREASATFRNSLPVAGVDGTLARRFTASNVTANAWLKTGGLNDVRSLAGYIRREDGTMLTFVAVLNHPRAPQAAAVIDRAVEWAIRP